MGVLIFNSDYYFCEWIPCGPRRGHCFFEGRSDQICFDLPVPRLGKKNKNPQTHPGSIIAEGRGRGWYQIKSGPNPTSSSITIGPRRGTNYRAHLVHPPFHIFHIIHLESPQLERRWRCISCALFFLGYLVHSFSVDREGFSIRDSFGRGSLCFLESK